MTERRAISARLKLALSYAGFLVVAGLMLLAIGLFLLRYIPEGNIVLLESNGSTRFVPDRSDLLRAFGPVAIGVVLFLLATGLLGGWFLAGRMLRPLATISDAARLAAKGSLTHRVGLDGPRDEFRELADVFDTMLAQLERHVGEQERFAANASHELRTPLAITRTVLEVARADPHRDVDKLIEQLQRVNARAVSLTEALLLLARIERQTIEGEDVDVSLVVEEAAELLQSEADRRGVVLEVGGESAFASGSPPLLQQLASNLIHNAIVHNHPNGGSVWVRTERVQGGAAELVVENTGEILAAELVTTFTEPFQRGAERSRRNSDHGGVGLGLTIAESIARAHGGTLMLAPRLEGGLVATVRLPALAAGAAASGRNELP